MIGQIKISRQARDFIGVLDDEILEPVYAQIMKLMKAFLSS